MNITLSLALYGIVFFTSPLQFNITILFRNIWGRINRWFILLSGSNAIGPENVETAVIKTYKGKFFNVLFKLCILYFSTNVWDSWIQFLLSIQIVAIYNIIKMLIIIYYHIDSIIINSLDYIHELIQKK